MSVPMESSRREFVRRIGVAGLGLTAGLHLGACGGRGRRTGPPNVVLIFTDDQGYADVGVYGAEGFETPNLDRLAREGIRFTDFYASQAVCSASRASLLTGCYAERVSILGALSPTSEVGLHSDETTIAEMLKPLGYATAIFGKWHLGHHPEFLPPQHGFDEYFGIPYSNDMWPVEYDGTRAEGGNKAAHPPLPLVDGNSVVETIPDMAGQDRLTTRYTERAVSFIDRNRHQPFFLYLAHSMPHVPLGVSERFDGHSRQGPYGDVIEEIDWSVGQVLEALDRHGIAEDTLVIFTSDNGPWLNFGNHAGSTGPLREGKGTAFEGGPRVPAIMRWPGVIGAGGVSSKLASTLDVLPTIAAATGAALPVNPIDGVDLLPVLEGDQASTPRDQLLFYYGGELRAVREGRWKRVFEHRTRSYEGVEPGMDGLPGPYAFPTVPTALYDLEADIGETTDLAAQYPNVVRRLDALAERAREALGDRLTGRVGSEVRPPGRRRFQRPDTASHLGLGAAVTLGFDPSPHYPGSGAPTLTDGRFGSRDHHDGHWLGWSGEDMVVTLDLGSARDITRVGVSCLQAQGPWIFFPTIVQVSGSVDGQEWKPLGELPVDLRQDPATAARTFWVDMPGRQGADQGTSGAVPERVRFLGVRAGNVGTLPAWHPAHPEQAWLFVDEILVE